MINYNSNSLRQLKWLVTCIILTANVDAHCQNNRAVFDANFVFNDGIYTTYAEVVQNRPKYPDRFIEIDVDIWFGQEKRSLIDTNNTKRKYSDRLFAVAKDGILSIYDGSNLSGLIIKGTISTYAARKFDGNGNLYHILYFVDFKTGKSEKLKPQNILVVFERDQELHAQFNKLSKKKQKKFLYAYIKEFNRRNPIYFYN